MRSWMVIILLFVLASSASAAMVNIDFQLQINQGSLSIGSLVTDQYSSQGVVFAIDGTASGPVADGFGTSWTRGLYSSNKLNPPVSAIFSIPVTTVTFSSISGSPLSVTAYNRFNEQIAYTSISALDTFGSIETSQRIDYISLLNDSGTGYLDRRDLSILSALSFGVVDLTPVPLPSAFMLFSIGLLSLARTFRKNKLNNGS